MQLVYLAGCWGNYHFNDIVNDRALDAILALKAIVDDETSTISLRVAWPLRAVNLEGARPRTTTHDHRRQVFRGLRNEQLSESMSI